MWGGLRKKLLGEKCPLLLWNLLAVIANMYLLPGLRLYGLKLSQGEEMPEGWKKKERCLKTQKGAEKGNLFLWVFWIMHLCKWRTQKDLCPLRLWVNRAKPTPGSQLMVWNVSGYSPHLHVRLDRERIHLLDWSSPRPYLEITCKWLTHHIPHQWLLTWEKMHFTCGSSCWSPWVSFLCAHQGNIIIWIWHRSIVRQHTG